MLQQQIQTLTRSCWFERLIIGLILLNAAILGLETSEAMTQKYGDWFETRLIAAYRAYRDTHTRLKGLIPEKFM